MADGGGRRARDFRFVNLALLAPVSSVVEGRPQRRRPSVRARWVRCPHFRETGRRPFPLTAAGPTPTLALLRNFTDATISLTRRYYRAGFENDSTTPTASSSTPSTTWATSFISPRSGGCPPFWKWTHRNWVRASCIGPACCRSAGDLPWRS